jgi:glycosyltransferase involved in cell wall biosynthesis
VIDVVLPCRDEAGALPWVLARLPDGYRAVVVDNGSRDATAAVARHLGATVVSQPVPGYGAAVQAGLLAATSEVVAVLDADASLDPGELPRLVAALGGPGGVDLVVGRRRPVGRGVWPWHARMGTALVARRLRRTLGLPVHDIGPARVARRAALLGLGVTDRRSGYPLQTLALAAQSGWRVVEVDVAYRPRAAGTRSKVSGSLVGSLRAARDFAAVLLP